MRVPVEISGNNPSDCIYYENISKLPASKEGTVTKDGSVIDTAKDSTADMYSAGYMPLVQQSMDITSCYATVTHDYHVSKH